jgi:hypothetical protein
MLLVQQARFILLICDKVTTLNNQSWISIHVYIVENWHRVPIFLNLERIVHGGTSDNLTSIIIRSLVIFGGMLETNITNKIVCFGANSVIVFQSLKSDVTIQLVSKHCLFVVRIYCMAHRCNFII